MKLTAKFWKSKTESKVQPSLVGKIAVTESNLNPNGTAAIDGEIYDVKAQDDYIEVGRGVRVTKIRGKKIFVKRV